MDQNFIQLSKQHSSQKATLSSLTHTQTENLEQSISEAISTLDAEHALKFLESLQQSSHSVLCHRAQLYAKLQNYKLAFEMCQKAIQLPSQCIKCIRLYACLFEVLLPRKVPLLDLLIQKCEKGQIGDTELSDSLRKIKQSQNIDKGYQGFLTDLQQGGAEFSKLSIFSQKADNRTVITRVQVQKDQTILFVPKNKLILLQNARDSQIVKKIHEQRLYLRSPKHCQLTIFLLEQAEKGKQSSFRHYLEHLPKNFDTFPINYKPEQLEYLKGSSFLDQVEQKITDMKRDYEAICSVYPGFRKYEYEDFKNYRLVVSSRLFGINVGKFRTDAMVPLADMLNHHIPKQTSWFYSDQLQGFVIKSLKKIDKGQQIYDSYGQKCNSRFLLNYGFTIPQNDINQVIIKVPFEYEEDQRVEIYREISLKISKNIESKEFWEMISILRHSVTQQSQTQQEWCIDSIKETPFISLDVEAQIWQKLQKIVQTQLAAYPTTLKQDRKLLLSKDLSINYQNCIILRKGEKDILHFYQTMAKKIIKYLRGGAGQRGMEQVREYESYLKQLNFS